MKKIYINIIIIICMIILISFIPYGLNVNYPNVKVLNDTNVYCREVFFWLSLILIPLIAVISIIIIYFLPKPS